MKVSMAWLRDWVHWPAEWDATELARRMTLAGFEIETTTSAAPPFTGVVVAKIISVEPHPQADKLRVCRVVTSERSAEDGAPVGDVTRDAEPGATSAPSEAATPPQPSDAAEAPLQIVCGAANARVGLVTALAKVGAMLPNNVSIRTAKLRGVESAGMLCSARELGLADNSEGIIELPIQARLGLDVRRYLDLDDLIFEINVTPNRGDAMSMLGIAREVGTFDGAMLKTRSASAVGTSSQAPVQAPVQAPPQPQLPLQAEPHQPLDDADRIGLTVQPGAGAGRFLARTLRGVDNGRSSPLWLRERLRRAGVRSISPVVDVTNFVMLELGQPMHAYDVAKLHGGLAARRALADERVQLLDGREVELAEDVLVIADEQSAIGLAGIMGGARTAIEAESRDIVLEVAWFAPWAIAGRARRYGLTTDASQRFERGVDWRGQERALARAVHLIQQIAGGSPGALALATDDAALPHTPTVSLRPQQLQRLLGLPIAAGQVEHRLQILGMTVSQQHGVWQVQPPSWRFDIAIESDLIEEVARLGGFDAIAERDALLPIVPRALPSRQIDEGVVMRTLVARGYQEVITFAFVDPMLQRQLFGEQRSIELANPIASDLAVMRSSLWPGLLSVARENLRRQQQRIRLFEIGTRFTLADEAAAGAPDADADADAEAGRRGAGSAYREQKMLGGLVLGARLPEQWGSTARPIDFYDVKGDLSSLLALSGASAQISYEPVALACLHPGRSARVLCAGEAIGMIGELHPGLVRALDLTYAPILFELDYAAAFRPAQDAVAHLREVSRFPRIRRDISVTVPEQLAFAALYERVSVTAASLLKELRVFDVYHGSGVESGRKSLALGLILQDLNRTLTDEDADRIVRDVLDDLQTKLDARVRE